MVPPYCFQFSAGFSTDPYRAIKQESSGISLQYRAYAPKHGLLNTQATYYQVRKNLANPAWEQSDETGARDKKGNNGQYAPDNTIDRIPVTATTDLKEHPFIGRRSI